MKMGVVKKSIVLGIIMLFIGTSIIPSISGRNEKFDCYKTSSPLDQLDQQQTELNTAYGFSAVRRPAQSFRPSLPVLTRVELNVAVTGSATVPLQLHIRSSLSGSDLRSAAVPPGNMTDVQDWVTFDFADLNVNIDQTYYIILSHNIPDTKGYYWWGGNTNDLYSRGKAFWSPDSGVTWQEDPYISDYGFKTYGSGGGNQPVIEIDQIKGGFGISAVIKNNGTTAATNISWSIDISGGWIILSGDHTEGTIDELAGGASETIKAKPRGIGPVIITVQAGDAVKQASAFLLGPLMLRVTEL